MVQIGLPLDVFVRGLLLARGEFDMSNTQSSTSLSRVRSDKEERVADAVVSSAYRR